MKLVELTFSSIDIHKFGNDLEICGMITGNGKELYIIPFTSVDYSDIDFEIIDMTKEDWDKLLFQLDHLEVIVRAKDDNGKLQKIILRKSQRQIDTNIQWNVFRRDNYTCQYCGKNNVPLTVDHIILWEDMGQSIEDNLISACKKCNKTRGNMGFEDWRKDEYYLKVIPNSIVDERNFTLFERAKQLPLRKFERSR